MLFKTDTFENISKVMLIKSLKRKYKCRIAFEHGEKKQRWG